MTARQRVLDAIAHRQPDRVPIDFWAAPEVFAQLQDALRLPDKEAVLRWFDVDLRYYDGPPRRGGEPPPAAGGVVEDHWGVRREIATVTGWRRDGSPYTWTYKHLLSSPLGGADGVRDIESHPWPDPEAWDFSGVRAACLALRRTGHAVAAGADRLDRAAQLKTAMYLRGTEQFMADLVLQPDVAECILQHIADYYLRYYRRLFQVAGDALDIFFMGDDMGTQTSTWVSPEMYRRFFKRRFAAYCDLAHQFGLKVMYHTCGNVTALVADFLDAGLDVLQSLQPAAMGDRMASLKALYGSRLAFQGGIDIQGVLPRGTPEDVSRHVRSRFEALGGGGGYIFGTAHSILPDVPTGNILALVEAYHRWGKY